MTEIKMKNFFIEPGVSLTTPSGARKFLTLWLFGGMGGGLDGWDQVIEVAGRVFHLATLNDDIAKIPDAEAMALAQAAQEDWEQYLAKEQARQTKD